MQFHNFANLRKEEMKRQNLQEQPEVFLTGQKAQKGERDGRILLGDNTSDPVGGGRGCNAAAGQVSVCCSLYFSRNA